MQTILRRPHPFTLNLTIIILPRKGTKLSQIIDHANGATHVVNGIVKIFVPHRGLPQLDIEIPLQISVTIRPLDPASSVNVTGRMKPSQRSGQRRLIIKRLKHLFVDRQQAVTATFQPTLPIRTRVGYFTTNINRLLCLNSRQSNSEVIADPVDDSITLGHGIRKSVPGKGTVLNSRPNIFGQLAIHVLDIKISIDHAPRLILMPQTLQLWF